MYIIHNMKAIVFKEYGKADVLKLAEVDKPLPKDNEVLINIKATAVNSGDWRLRKPDPAAARLFTGFVRPWKQILGVVFSGKVAEVGSAVDKYKVGDEVFGTSGMRLGTYAEYIALPQDAVMALKPTTLSHTEAAVIPFGGTTALHFIKKADIKKGQQVLLYGASGAVGSAALQLAKYYGAKVTAVCSTSSIELVQSLGADEVIDYTKQDVNQNSIKYDVVFVTVNKISFDASYRMLKDGGTLVLCDTGLYEMYRGVVANLRGKSKVYFGMIHETAEDIQFLSMLIDHGFYKPVIDRIYPLREMAAAHAYAEQGHKKGNVAIAV